MSSSKRQPSKQKRASQNRAQRQALQQRKVAASSASGSSTSSGRSGRGGSSLFGRLRSSMTAPSGGGGGRARTTARGTGVGPGADGGSTQPIGYRAALTGLLAAGASLVVCVIAIRVPVDRDGDLYTPERLAAEWTSTAVGVAVANPEADADAVVEEIDEWAPDREKELIAVAIWPVSLTLVLPVIGAFAGFRAVSRRRGSKIVNRAMFAALLGAFLTQGLFLLFLPSVIALGIAAFQIRKAEAMAAAEAAADGDTIDGDVIDADVIDADVVLKDDDADRS